MEKRERPLSRTSVTNTARKMNERNIEGLNLKLTTVEMPCSFMLTP